MHQTLPMNPLKVIKCKNTFFLSHLQRAFNPLTAKFIVKREKAINKMLHFVVLYIRNDHNFSVFAFQSKVFFLSRVALNLLVTFSPLFFLSGVFFLLIMNFIHLLPDSFSF